jgi:hypothetical protein
MNSFDHPAQIKRSKQARYRRIRMAAWYVRGGGTSNIAAIYRVSRSRAFYLIQCGIRTAMTSRGRPTQEIIEIKEFVKRNAGRYRKPKIFIESNWFFSMKYPKQEKVDGEHRREMPTL